MLKKNVKFKGGNMDEGSDEEEEVKDEHTTKMEEGGFTMVMADQEGGDRGKGSDGIATMKGISSVKAEEYFNKKRMAKEEIDEPDQIKYESNKKKKEKFKNDFYKFQIKEVKKQALEDLRKGFEEDRRRLAKMMLK